MNGILKRVKKSIALLLSVAVFVTTSDVAMLQTMAETDDYGVVISQDVSGTGGYGVAIEGAAGSCGLTEDDNLTWTVYDSDKDDDGDTLVISGTGDMADYTYTSGETPIPWLEYEDMIETIEIDAGVTYIGTNAFSGFGALTTINFGENSQLTEIGERAFWQNTALKNVDLSPLTNLRTLGEEVFFNCYKLKEVILPEGLVSIEYLALSNCVFESITIPASVEEIGDEAFYGCKKLKEIKFAGNSKLKSIGEYAFGSWGLEQPLVIPFGVEEIGPRAFQCYEAASDTLEFLGTTVPTIVGDYLFGFGDLSWKALKIVIVPKGTEDAYKTALGASLTNLGLTTDAVIGVTEVVGAEACEAISVSPNTTRETISLPETVPVTLADDSRINVSVDWDTELFDSVDGETYTLTGALVMPTDLGYLVRNTGNYTTSISVYVRKYNQIQPVEQAISKVYDTTAFELSTDLFTWHGSNEPVITGYYVDTDGTKTNGENSGAAGEGSAPINAGTYYVMLQVEGDSEYEETISDYIPFTISKITGEIANKDYGVNYTFTGERVATPLADNFKYNNVESSVAFTWYAGDFTQKALSEEAKLLTGPVDVGIYTLVATVSESKNYTAAEVRLLVTVAKADISAESIVITPYSETYDEEAHEAVSASGNPLGTTLSYCYSTDEGSTWSNFTDEIPLILDAGSVSVKVKVSGDNYNDWESEAVKAVVSPRVMSDENIEISLDADSYTYTGEAIDVTASVSWKSPQVELIPVTDYVISVRNNVNAASSDSENAPTVVITGVGNYSGTVEKAFTINKGDAVITVEEGKEAVSGVYGTAFSLTGISANFGADVVYEVTSGEDIITVDKDGLITPLLPGDTIVTVKVPGTSNYNAAEEKTIAVTIEKLDMPAIVPSESVSVNNAVKTVSGVSLPENWEWDEESCDKELLPGESVEALAIYTGSDAICYKTITKVVTITRAVCEEDSTILFTGEGEKVPTCTEDGVGHTECKHCSAVMRVGIAVVAVGHTWDDGVVTKEATATEKGVKTYTCKNCGEKKTEDIATLGVPAEDVILTDPATDGEYKVTESDVKEGTVEYVQPTQDGVKNVTVPDFVKIGGIEYKVTAIAPNAFKNNKKLTKIIIGSNIETIGKNAFYGCSKLKTVSGGKNVAVIGDKAFYKCTSLTKITLHSKVRKIGKKAFYGCKKLKNITIKTKKLTSKNVGSKAFTGTYKKAKVKVPKSKLKAYKKWLVKKGINKKAKIRK